jgi:hypothetical protein
VQMLIDAAEDRGPMLFARMGIVRALEAHAERALNPDRQVQARRVCGARVTSASKSGSASLAILPKHLTAFQPRQP